eukprot:22286-Hanusia_phi.AAC.1
MKEDDFDDEGMRREGGVGKGGEGRKGGGREGGGRGGGSGDIATFDTACNDCRCASNNDLDMWCEMRIAAFLGKLIANDPEAVPAEKV